MKIDGKIPTESEINQLNKEVTMDKSKLPKMGKKSKDLTKKKKTKAGAVDDDAMRRVKKRNKMLKDAMKY